MLCWYFSIAEGFSWCITSLELRDCDTADASCRDDAFLDKTVALEFGIQALPLSEYISAAALFSCNAAVYILRHPDLCRRSGSAALGESRTAKLTFSD